MSDELCFLSATAAIAAFEARRLSPVELLDALIARTEAVNPSLNAITDRYFEEARAAARASEARYMGTGQAPRPLEGVPVAVKDAQRVAGKRTTQGSLIFMDHVDEQSDPMIERLEGAGAIIAFRTTVPEFCLSGMCHSRAWGVTRNPFNRAFAPGGSSGGSAAALAAGMVPLATGTDIGGSIRIPAAACGVVGFKPPHGRNPDGPPANFDRYNHCGPLARTVGDVALMQNVVSGPHPRDHDSLRETIRIPDNPEPATGLRVAWSMDLGYRPIDPDVRSNTLAALDVFRAIGAHVEEVDLGWGPDCDTAAMHWYGTMHFGRQPLWQAREHASLMTPYARAAAETARKTSVDDVSWSWQIQHEMYQSFGRIMQDFDVFVCPTNALAAVAAEHDPVDPAFTVDGVIMDAEYGWVLTHHFNMLQYCPVMAVPSGFDRNRVPTGIQIVGRTFDDLSVFRAAWHYESACGGWFADPAARPAL